MNPALDHTAPVVPSIFDHFPKPSTQAKNEVERRKVAFLSSLVGVPVAAGLALGLISGRPLRGLVAGGVAALALGALRWQLSRWFTDEPAYDLEAEVGDLEIRRYPVRIEARSEIAEAHDFESALDRGFGRLACYIFGANGEHRDIAMTAPVITTMRDGRYLTSFVMPPEQPLAALPRPDDVRIELREVPETRIAVLRFRGRFTKENVERHERALLRQLVDAGLSARGSVMFAGYDSPATLPILRRNELWIEIV